MARPRPRREPEFEGGSQPVRDRPPDEPGSGRTVLYAVVTVLGTLLLGLPVAWGLGALATVGQAAGTAGLIILWITWGLILMAFIWLAWSMWRRSG